MTAIPLRQDIHYPESDGKPMGETEVHIREIMYLFQALNEHLRHAPEAYVGANMFLYYVPGQPQLSVVPDVFVATGVPRGERRTYKLWEEGQPPCLVIEVTSPSTRREDLQEKKALYESMGVEDYVLHDPLGEYLNPALQGFRLVNGRYQAIVPERDGSLQIGAVGTLLRQEGRRLRVVDIATGQPILSDEEVREENARLRAELERLRAGNG